MSVHSVHSRLMTSRQCKAHAKSTNSREPSFNKIAFAVVVTAALVLGAWSCRGRFPQATHSAKSGNPAPRTDWSTYNGGLTGDHYSPLDQITVANVSHLKQVWRFDSGTDGGVQTNSLVVGRVLYGYGPTLQVIALDGATGKQLYNVLHCGPPMPSKIQL